MRARIYSEDVFVAENENVVTVKTDDYRDIFEEAGSTLGPTARAVLQALEVTKGMGVLISGVDTIVRSAKCESEENFDEAFGVSVAENKIYLKLHSHIAKDYRKAAAELKKLTDSFEQLAEEHEKKRDNILEDFERMYKK